MAWGQAEGIRQQGIQIDRARDIPCVVKRIMLTAEDYRSAPVLTALRVRTRDLHEHVERSIQLDSRLATIAEYRGLLERYFGFYEPVERLLTSEQLASAWASIGLAASRRRKLDLLASDLSTLGLSGSDIAGLPLCLPPALPCPTSVTELIGCVYVLEGSTLGGQIIGKQIESQLGVRPGEPGARFFYSYGTEIGTMWRRFRLAAEIYALERDRARPGAAAVITDEAVASARATFTAIESWLHWPPSSGDPVDVAVPPRPLLPAERPPS